MPKVLGIVLAGGEGKRLMPLTLDRAKPAVPFGGSYRLIDFALSNLVNAGYLQCCVLTQYKSHSLDRHISLTWRMSTHARQLRHPGAGAAAARPAVVPRQRRRDLPVDEPDQRRAARHHRRVRRRPRVPDGRLADGAGTCRLRRRRHRGRHPRAAQGGLAVRGDQDRWRTGRRSRSSSRSPPTHRGSSTLRTSRSRRWATTCSAPTCWSTRWRRTRPTRTPATTWAATSSRCWSKPGQAVVYDFKRQRRARLQRARPRLLARRRDAGLATTRHTSTWCR